MSSPRRSGHHLPIVLCLVAVSGVLRWGVADFSQWGIDEAANLWQGTRLLAGEAVPIGLISSRGVPNLSGAPAIAAPFSLLPDLFSISVVLSLLHLCCLVAFGLALGRRWGRTATIVAALAFHPALLLASSSLWNQYLTVLFTALLLPLLLALGEGTGSPTSRAAALVAFAALALAQPAVHLASFADLGVHAVLVAAVLVLRPAPVAAPVLVPGLVAVLGAATVLYFPWLERVVDDRSDGLAAASGLAIAALGLTISRRRQARAALATLAERAFRNRAASWLWLTSLLVTLAVVAVVPFTGAQTGSRLLEAREPAGLLLLAAQAGMAAAALPELSRILRECRLGTPLGELLRSNFAGVGRAVPLLLAAYPIALLALRLLLEPKILFPGGRADLLLPLVPALLGPLLLLAAFSRVASVPRMLRFSTGAAAAGFLWLSLTGLSPGFRREHPSFVPPGEMREAVDEVALRHRARGGGREIDLGYDLGKGLEWVNEVACRPWTSWYSIGRSYDWLLLRRHGLRNVREGECLRLGGTGFQLGFVTQGPAPAGMDVVRRLDHLEVRVRRN